MVVRQFKGPLPPRSGVRCHRAGGGVLRPSARRPHRSGPGRPVPLRQPAAARQPDRRLLREEGARGLQTAAGQFQHASAN